MKNLFKALGSLLPRDDIRDREMAYLNESSSIADVERRMREIDGGRFRTRYGGHL